MSDRRNETPAEIPEDDLAGFEARLAREAEQSQADEREKIKTLAMALGVVLGLAIAAFGAVVSILAEAGTKPNALRVAIGGAAFGLFCGGVMTYQQLRDLRSGKG